MLSIYINSNIIRKEQEIKYYKAKSTDTRFIDEIKYTSFDFIYLDGAHDHDNVKIELNLLWPLIRSGGVMAGTRGGGIVS